MLGSYLLSRWFLEVLKNKIVYRDEADSLLHFSTKYKNTHKINQNKVIKDNYILVLYVFDMYVELLFGT